MTALLCFSTAYASSTSENALTPTGSSRAVSASIAAVAAAALRHSTCVPRQHRAWSHPTRLLVRVSLHPEVAGDELEQRVDTVLP